MSDWFPYSDSDPKNFFRIRSAQKHNRSVRIGMHITGPEAKKHHSGGMIGTCAKNFKKISVDTVPLRRVCSKTGRVLDTEAAQTAIIASLRQKRACEPGSQTCTLVVCIFTQS
jgi:hypothetical protein